MWDGLKEKLRDGVIVSVQASGDEPLNRPEMLTALALSALNGGACALRMANTDTEDNIGYFKARYPEVVVIGLTKPVKIPRDYKSQVYITPTYRDIERLLRAKADIIAMDATGRTRPQELLRDIVKRVRMEFPWTPLMADVSTILEGVTAEKMGFDILSTTLSGYTTETEAKEAEGPDFDLLAELVKQVSIPVVLEGRVWSPEEVAHGFALGAHAVVIGSAVTRPQLITRRFCQAAPQRRRLAY